MLFKLIMLFTVVPFLELALLLKINEYIGLGYTLMIVLITGFAGAYLAKSEGKGIIRNIRYEMSQGRMPGDELINALCVLLGGAGLLAPGLITDFMGFILVIPYTREIIKRFIKGRLRHMLEEGTFKFIYRR